MTIILGTNLRPPEVDGWVFPVDSGDKLKRTNPASPGLRGELVESGRDSRLADDRTAASPYLSRIPFITIAFHRRIVIRNSETPRFFTRLPINPDQKKGVDPPADLNAIF